MFLVHQKRKTDLVSKLQFFIANLTS